jgi:uncharacterized protein YdeI (YjbR/CyaY-like superfamily)
MSFRVRAAMRQACYFSAGEVIVIATDTRVDAYIENSPEFAQPILVKLRELVHTACPEVTETIKWGAPAYEYKGVLAIMASMKHHAVFNLWKGELIPEVKELYSEKFSMAMGTFGKITSVEDLPPDEKVIGWIREAMELNARGVKLPQRTRSEPKPEPEVPDELIVALEQNDPARLTFESFSPSRRREYVEWITEAKTDATRQKRLTQAIEWMADGKHRNWKYDKKK